MLCDVLQSFHQQSWPVTIASRQSRSRRTNAPCGLGENALSGEEIAGLDVSLVCAHRNPHGRRISNSDSPVWPGLGNWNRERSKKVSHEQEAHA